MLNVQENSISELQTILSSYQKELPTSLEAKVNQPQTSVGVFPFGGIKTTPLPLLKQIKS